MEMIVEGRIIGESAIGKFLIVKKGQSDYLPIGFEAKILGIEDGKLMLLDIDNTLDNPYDILISDMEADGWEFTLGAGWVPITDSTYQQRKELAGKFKGVSETLKNLTEQAKEYGMTIGDGELTFTAPQPETEEY